MIRIILTICFLCLPCFAYDMNCDGSCDMLDFAELAKGWGDIYDMDDLSRLASNFANPNYVQDEFDSVDWSLLNGSSWYIKYFPQILLYSDLLGYENVSDFIQYFNTLVGFTSIQPDLDVEFDYPDAPSSFDLTFGNPVLRSYSIEFLASPEVFIPVYGVLGHNFGNNRYINMSAFYYLAPCLLTNNLTGETIRLICVLPYHISDCLSGSLQYWYSPGNSTYTYYFGAFADDSNYFARFLYSIDFDNQLLNFPIDLQPVTFGDYFNNPSYLNPYYPPRFHFIGDTYYFFNVSHHYGSGMMLRNFLFCSLPIPLGNPFYYDGVYSDTVVGTRVEHLRPVISYNYNPIVIQPAVYRWNFSDYQTYSDLYTDDISNASTYTDVIDFNFEWRLSSNFYSENLIPEDETFTIPLGGFGHDFGDLSVSSDPIIPGFDFDNIRNIFRLIIKFFITFFFVQRVFYTLTEHKGDDDDDIDEDD